jgi:hypothetical protein
MLMGGTSYFTGRAAEVMIALVGGPMGTKEFVG